MKSFYPTANLLRAVATIMVCLFHFFFYSDFRGELFTEKESMLYFEHFLASGVYIFFTLSGFVIPLSLFRYQYSYKKIPFFLWRRFVRLQIPYTISIVLILIVAFVFSVKNNTPFEVDGTRILLHISYLVPFSYVEWYNPIYWTLAIEFQFYIFLAFIYILLSSKNKLIIFLGVFLFGFSNFFNDNRFVFHYSVIFLQGILLFLVKTEKINKKTGFVLIGVCAVATGFIHSVVIAFLSFATVLCIHFVEINQKIANHLGNISYSLYLTHGFVGGNILYLFSRYTHTDFTKTLLVFIALTASLLFAFLFWKWIEKPSQKLSKRIKL